MDFATFTKHIFNLMKQKLLSRDHFFENKDENYFCMNDKFRPVTRTAAPSARNRMTVY